MRSAMKKITIEKAYACGSCGKLFDMKPRTWMTLERGRTIAQYRAAMKKCAQLCCSCPRCGEKCDRYFGTNDKLCTACKSGATTERVTAELQRALQQYVAHGVLNENVESKMRSWVEFATLDIPKTIDVTITNRMKRT